MSRNNHFDKNFGVAMLPAMFLLVTIWLVFWGDSLFLFQFYKLGVLPNDLSGLKGILFMPLIHSSENFNHIFNNSIPTFLLTTLLFYFYKEIAFRVLIFSWIFTGVGVWLFAVNRGAFHIGMSGVIYSLVAFLFTSGTLRKYRPLQALSLFIVFVYGSLIWGILPISPKISWEGHFMGFIVGTILGFIYRKQGPQRPKYIYEIEKELGIEPPDLEGMYWQKVRAEAERKAEQEQELKIVYHIKSESSEDKNMDP
ncbi:MAG: rhomboid family intramembrane serine protease [Crocinitomicaceae bacterium]|jgi:membrane associated rhomboid family serine protease|tara:strand:+ start:3403 stop:4164 length:762 start_codon:yes stop_codon:yes gene_type:complete